MKSPLPNSYWVEPGRLLAGEYPYGMDEASARERLQRLLDAGIDSFIDLTHGGEAPDYRRLLPAGVEYLRSPILDASVPSEGAQMRALQQYLQVALAAGRHVYVHCRAGIGRTGLVIGCYLADRRGDGHAALAELNRLWQHCARSAHWPEVPQTAQQADFVRGWPQQQPAAGELQQLTALRPLRARFSGCLLGLALGDALGAATQYRRAGSFAPLGDLIGGGPFELPRGAWSDDTALALCAAESLLQAEGFDAPTLLHCCQRWQQEGYLSATGQCLGITAATVRALRAAAPAAAGTSSEGAPLARIASTVLYYFPHQADALRQVQAAARLFAAADEVLDAACALAAMLNAALRAEPLASVLQPARTAFGEEPLAPAVARLMMRDPASAPPASDAGVLGLLGAVRWALASGGGFRGGALRIANLGADSDVAGAVYGQLAGAFYGADALPSAWLAALARRTLIEDLADRLLTVALVRLVDV